MDCLSSDTASGHFFQPNCRRKVSVCFQVIAKPDEKVAMLHLKKVGAKLTKLSKEQADYISVETEGPFKPDAYRY